MTMTLNKTINELDPDLAKAVEQEQKRQEEHIELIASENYTTRLVMELQGSVLTNKYAEGFQADAITAAVNMSMKLKR